LRRVPRRDQNAGAAGALFIVGSDTADQPPRAAEYVARILKGAKPGDLPIDRPVQTVMPVDLRVARQLGIKIPESVLLRATKVIE
jgi:putative ABC transport system substrate-binding protein